MATHDFQIFYELLNSESQNQLCQTGKTSANKIVPDQSDQGLLVCFLQHSIYCQLRWVIFR